MKETNTKNSAPFDIQNDPKELELEIDIYNNLII